MAEVSVTVDQNQFNCPICLDLLKDPVAIPCGHSYCMSCIKSCWDQEDHLGVYSCHQCRETFIPRPVLGRNTILAEVVETLKKSGLQAATPADHYAGPGDVECDFCTERKHKAVKSCLVCLASYCKTHLQPHYEFPVFKKHELTDATGHLQDKICSHHDKLLEIYCRTDKQCICYLCMLDEHRGHDTVSAAAGRAEKQEQMGETQREFQQRIQMREKELQELREAVDSITKQIGETKRYFQQRIQMREKELQELREAVGSITSSAQSAVEDSERIFIEMISSIHRRRSEVTQLTIDQVNAAVSQAEGHMEILEEEIDELKRRHSELEQLSHTEDHIHFLQKCQGLPVTPQAEFGHKISVYPRCSLENVRKEVSKLKDQLENVCEKKTAEIRHTVTKDTILPPLVPRTRAEFLQYSCRLTLNPNTANDNLHLSEGNRVVTWKRETESYPDHRERFDSPCVLCRESLTGRCYWEVDWSGTMVSIAVAYKGINRKGWDDDSWLGHNDKSWCLSCSTSSYSFWHNNLQTAVSGPISSKIGVYLDHRAGSLSFYSFSDTVTLLHRVQTTFTEPLYPGFVLWSSSAKLC